MEYVISRPYPLPTTTAELNGALFFNMWGRRYWPYGALEIGDLLIWYYSPGKAIVWRSRAVDVDRFPYDDKDALKAKIENRFGPFDHAQPYFQEGTESGYCLAYRVEAQAKIHVPKPESFRFPQLGWMKPDLPEAEEWLARAKIAPGS